VKEIPKQQSILIAAKLLLIASGKMQKARNGFKMEFISKREAEHKD
jgi:hypothetical protein